MNEPKYIEQKSVKALAVHMKHKLTDNL